MLPVELLHMVIKLVGTGGVEFQKRLENPQCCAATKIGTVHHFLVAHKGHHAPSFGHFVGAQRSQLVGKHSFQALKGLGHHFKLVIHRFQ